MIQDGGDHPHTIIASLPLDNLMQAMAVSLRADKADGINELLAVRFTDLNRSYTIHVRNGIADIQQTTGSSAPLQVETDSFSWKKLLSGRESFAGQILTGALELSGSKVDIARFLLLFQAN